jgi:hypothetical protein
VDAWLQILNVSTVSSILTALEMVKAGVSLLEECARETRADLSVNISAFVVYLCGGICALLEAESATAADASSSLRGVLNTAMVTDTLAALVSHTALSTEARMLAGDACTKLAGLPTP